LSLRTVLLQLLHTRHRPVVTTDSSAAATVHSLPSSCHYGQFYSYCTLDTVQFALRTVLHLVYTRRRPVVTTDSSTAATVQSTPSSCHYGQFCSSYCTLDTVELSLRIVLLQLQYTRHRPVVTADSSAAGTVHSTPSSCHYGQFCFSYCTLDTAEVSVL
jgi:hypothetical protein